MPKADVHAFNFYSEKKIHYTFSFPNTGSNFTCISSTLCPQMDPPPACPPGYTEARENKTCGLNCRDIVGYTWRCPCNDWMSCAVKERYLWGCASGYYSSFRVRECAQGSFEIFQIFNILNSSFNAFYCAHFLAVKVLSF